MSDDIKKIADDLASKVAGKAVRLNDPPPPAPVERRSTLWDDDYRAPSAPSSYKPYTYRRDRWSRPLGEDRYASEPKTYNGTPFPWKQNEAPVEHRAGYTDADIDWDKAWSVKITRSTTWSDFLDIMKLDYMNESRDGDTFHKLRGIFLQRKSDTFRR